MKTPTATREIQDHASTGDRPWPVNVLHVICSLPLGGAENQVVTLASALDGEQYRVHVCCLRREGVQAEVLRSRGIPVVALNLRKRYLPIGIYRLYRLIKRLKPRVVHTHLYEADIWGKLAARWAGVPVVVSTLHGMPIWTKRQDVLVERFVDRHADRLIAVSEEIRQRYLGQEVAPPDKIVTIPTAVDLARFGASSCRELLRGELGIDASSPLIGVVARLVPEKRLDLFLEAARILCESVPQARFLIIGDGPLRRQLNDQASQLGLEPDRVQFLGSRQDIPDLLAALDIFVLSSGTEGLPVSMLEAMAASKPIVVTRVGAIPQVVQDRRNGLLVPPHDAAALANAIMVLISDNALRESISREARRTVEERFSTAVVTRQIAALYGDLLAKKESGHVS